MGKQSIGEDVTIVARGETEVIPPDPSGSTSGQSSHGLNFPPFSLSFFNFEDDEYVTIPHAEIDSTGSDAGLVGFLFNKSVDSENIYIDDYATFSVGFSLYLVLSYIFNIGASDG